MVHLAQQELLVQWDQWVHQVCLEKEEREVHLEKVVLQEKMALLVEPDLLDHLVREEHQEIQV